MSLGEDRHQDLALGNYHNQRLQTSQSREQTGESPLTFPLEHLSLWVKMYLQHAINILRKYTKNLSVNLIYIEMYPQTLKRLIKLSYQIDKSSC